MKVITSAFLLSFCAACGIDTDPNRQLNYGTIIFAEEAQRLAEQSED